MPAPPPAFISAYDAAALIGCSPHTIRRLIKRGVLAGVTLPCGRKLWLEREHVHAFKKGIEKDLAAQRVKAARTRAALHDMRGEL